MCDKIKEKMKKVLNEVKEKLPVYAEKMKKIANKVAAKVKEKAPIYWDMLKKIINKLVLKTKEYAPIYWEKTKKILKEIKTKAPIYTAKCVEFSKQNPKQVIVGGVILLVAFTLILFASSTTEKKIETTQEDASIQKVEVKKEVAPIKEDLAVVDDDNDVEEELSEAKVEEQKYVYFNFTALAKKDFGYQVFYTVKDEVWYDPKHVISFAGLAGENIYKVKIPAEKIYRIRLDFNVGNEEITVSDIYLSGEQEADLNNFEEYLFNDIAEKTINRDGSLTVVTMEQDPHIGYYIK
jgi:hypothetical protein